MFNAKAKTYNPRLHIIVQNELMADLLLKEWLQHCTPKFALRKAQDKTPIKNIKAKLLEVIKYGSKIFTEPDINNKLYLKENRTIYIAALNNILKAMKGLCIFDRFGFNLSTADKKK